MKYLFTIIVLVFISCNSNQNACDANIKEWIKEAPAVLEEFLLVKQEILANKEFIDSISVKGDLFVYTNTVNSAELVYFNMPLLKEWFGKERGYINFEEGDTSAIFKECFESMGKLHLGRFDRSKYNSAVKIVDTIKLKGDWYAEVSKCSNCGD